MTGWVAAIATSLGETVNRRLGLALLVPLLAAVGLTSCIPDPTHLCPLSAGRTAVQACINDPAHSSSKLTGTATWPINNSTGLTIPAGKVVVLADNAELRIHYSDDNGSNTAVLVDGGDFWMRPGSVVAHHKNTGLTPVYRPQEENKRAIKVTNGGGAFIFSASVFSGGYTVSAEGNGNNRISLDSSVAWGMQGVTSVPKNGYVNEVAISNSTLVGTQTPLVVEPNGVQATSSVPQGAVAPLTKLVMQGTGLSDIDTDVYFGRMLGYIGVNPQATKPPGVNLSTIRVLSHDSYVRGNTGAPSNAVLRVFGCQDNPFGGSGDNDFFVSVLGCPGP